MNPKLFVVGQAINSASGLTAPVFTNCKQFETLEEAVAHAQRLTVLETAPFAVLKVLATVEPVQSQVTAKVTLL